MTDTSKRTTLKMIGAAAAGVGLGLSAGPVSAMWQSSAVNSTHDEIQIDIIHTSAVEENTLTLVNRTDAELSITQFTPGMVVFNNRLVDLNAALVSHPITLAPGGAYAARIEIWQLLAQPVLEYVWADHVVTQLSVETEVVSLKGIVTGSEAIVFTGGSDQINSSLS